MTYRRSLRQQIRGVLLYGSGIEMDRLEQTLLRNDFVAARGPRIDRALSSKELARCSGIIVTLEAARERSSGAEGAALSFNVPLLVLLPASGADNGVCHQLLQQGAAGFLEHACDIVDIERALERAAVGELWVSRGLLSWAFRQSLLEIGAKRLTAREQEILQEVAGGATNQEIAERLFVTRETVRWHLRTVYSKLGVHSRDAVVALLGGSFKKSPGV